MVQREALSTPECQEGVPIQVRQQREEHRVVHHDQVEHYQGQLSTMNQTMNRTMNHKTGLDPIDHPV